jgi:hypothetical protein
METLASWAPPVASVIARLTTCRQRMETAERRQQQQHCNDANILRYHMRSFLAVAIACSF